MFEIKRTNKLLTMSSQIISTWLVCSGWFRSSKGFTAVQIFVVVFSSVFEFWLVQFDQKCRNRADKRPNFYFTEKLVQRLRMKSSYCDCVNNLIVYYIPAEERRLTDICRWMSLYRDIDGTSLWQHNFQCGPHIRFIKAPNTAFEKIFENSIFFNFRA